MDVRLLLIMGLLEQQSLHGYAINDFVERYVDRVAGMKKSTAYALLQRLEKKGYVSVQLIDQGTRPPRQVYTLTESGREAFIDQLKKSLARPEQPFSGDDIPYLFMASLNPDERIALLKERLDMLYQYLEHYTTTMKHNESGVDIFLDHRVTLLRAEIAWLERLIATIGASIGDQH